MAERKTCSTCKRDLLLSEFHSHKNGLFGKRAVCKACRSAEAAARNKEIASHANLVACTEKTCSGCHIKLPSSEFYPCKYQKSGLRSRCKQCCNRDTVERKRGSKRALDANKRWRSRNKERYAAIRKASYEKHKARHRFDKNQRSSRRYHSIVIKHRIQEADWKALIFLFGGKCLLCGASGKLTIDHIIPVTKYGYHEISNIQPLCLSCNSTKHALVLDARPFEISSIDELRRLAAERGFNREEVQNGWSR